SCMKAPGGRVWKQHLCMKHWTNVYGSTGMHWAKRFVYGSARRMCIKVLGECV
ncbi:20150_t:CDS:2, partial [Dentiscutata erythropus]